MEKIRFCKAAELAKLQRFINDQWRINHLLAIDSHLMNWQHFNQSDNIFNFVVANDESTDSFTAILGYIPLWQFDINLFSELNIWLAIWKTDVNGSQIPGIGLQLLQFLENYFNPTSVCAIGINSKVKKIYQLLGYKTGILKQYYFLNPQNHIFKIAGATIQSKKYQIDSNLLISEIEDLSIFCDFQTSYNPKKSIQYIYQRYLKHPIYKYKLYGIFDPNNLKAILVIRKIFMSGNACLRIVDIYGNISLTSNISNGLAHLLENENAEYIDCLNYGIDESVFYNLGFSKRSNEIIIPNYFEPFENRNVDIEFAYKTNQENYVIFKGDSDQDRPSVIQ